jgi:hypothetical protein
MVGCNGHAGVGDSGSVRANGVRPVKKRICFLFFRVQFPINIEVENKSEKYLGASEKYEVFLKID